MIMSNQEQLILGMKKAGIDFFVGVPDSFLNGFCSYLTKNFTTKNHIIAANEGNAVGIAAGHYFATGKVPLVYMQNSGLGNAVNPLVSLVDKKVYSVPMILLIGWRGEPGINDWVQHQRQGDITQTMLQDMDIPYVIVDEDTDLKELVSKAVLRAENRKSPYALVVRKGILTEKKEMPKDTAYSMSREEAIDIILKEMPKDTFYVATTGRATRELYFLRERYKQDHSHDFLNVGAMGHASSVALGLAMGNRDRKIVCLDGDSATIMHMGALTMVSKADVPNYIHIVLNNGAHESVGGEPSAGFLIDFTGIAKSSGYNTLNGPITSREDLQKAMRGLGNVQGPVFIDVRIRQGITSELKALNISCGDLIQEFMDEIK